MQDVFPLFKIYVRLLIYSLPWCQEESGWVAGTIPYWLLPLQETSIMQAQVQSFSSICLNTTYIPMCSSVSFYSSLFISPSLQCLFYLRSCLITHLSQRDFFQTFAFIHSSQFMLELQIEEWKINWKRIICNFFLKISKVISFVMLDHEQTI